LVRRGIGVAPEHNTRALRLFSCPACGHRLRLGSPTCGKCYEPTPVHNRWIAWLAIVAVGAVAAGALVMRAISA